MGDLSTKQPCLMLKHQLSLHQRVYIGLGLYSTPRVKQNAKVPDVKRLTVKVRQVPDNQDETSVKRIVLESSHRERFSTRWKTQRRVQGMLSLIVIQRTPGDEVFSHNSPQEVP